MRLSLYSSHGYSQGKSLRSGGEKVIGGGLTVLETIGKKTYDVIAEGDHGLKETLRNKPNLSQVSLVRRPCAKYVTLRWWGGS